ncbi:MAG: ThuA domain-containing protein [Cyclobacteriaceae bacterium]
MNKLVHTISACLLGIIILSCTAQNQSDSDEINILVFSKTGGFRHKNINEGIASLREISNQNGWKLIASENAGFFTSDSLNEIDVVIFLNTTGDILAGDQEEAFERYIRNGGGFVGIHAAADTEYEWPFYQEMICAQFASHPKTQEARLVVKQDSKHPSIGHLDDEWIVTDEWYYFKEPLKAHAKILIELDESTITGKEPTGQVHPITWSHEEFGGRVIYTGIGHTKAQFSNPVYLEHLTRSINWAAGN